MVPLNASIELVACDLLDVWALQDAFAGVSQVFHCAAAVSFDPGKHRNLIESNVAVTANIVNAALEAKVGRFIHVSSVAALGRNTAADMETPLHIDEESHWIDSKGQSGYAVSKYQSELEVWRGIAEGLPAAIVNPGIILGEGDWERGSARLMHIVDKEFPWFTEGVNAFVDVKDVVEAMVCLMNSTVTGERFILSADNFGYKAVFTEMAHALDRKPPHKFAKKWMTSLVWRIAYLKARLRGSEATLTKETAVTAQRRCYYDNTKFPAAFPGFQYRALSETISRMAAAYRLAYPYEKR